MAIGRNWKEIWKAIWKPIWQPAEPPPGPVTGKFGKAIAVPNTGISMPTGLGVADHQDFDFGTGDFTIDLWAYRTANTYVGTLFYGTLGGGEFSVKVGTDSLIDLIYRSSGGSQSFSNVATWPLEEWVYFVTQRRGTNWETYLNGVLIHSAAITGGASSTVNSGGDLFFGRTNVSSVQSWNGYLDDIRVTRGAARNGDYYAPQLPTAEFPTNATGDRHWDKVRLLLKGEGATIVDSSSAARAISVLLGTPTTSTEQFVFGSRSIKMAVGAAAVQLRVDIGAAAENKAWTYEAWAYLTSRQTYTAFLSDDDANNAIMLRTPNNSGNYQLCILFGGAATYWALDPDPFPLNTWTHFAFCVMPGGHPVVLFVNGVKKAESPGVIATRSVYQPSGLTRIGRTDNAGFSGFPGYLEEARLTLGVARYTTDFPPPVATFCESVSSVVSPKPEATLQGRILKLTQGLLDPSLPPSDFAPVTGAVFYGSSSGTPRWVEWHLTPSGEILVATNEDPVPSWRVSSYSSPYYPHLWGTPVTPDVGTNYEVEFSYEDPQQFNVAYSGSQLNTRLSLASTRTVRVTNTNDFALTFERIVAKIYTSAGAHVGTVTLVSGISVLATTPVQPPLQQEAQSFSPSFVVVKVNPVQVGDYNNRALTLNPDGTVTFSPPYPDSGDARLPGLVAWLQNAPSGVDGRYYNVTLTRSGKVGLAGELVPGVSKDLSVSKTIVVFAPAFNAFGVSRIRLAFSPNNLHPAQALGTTSAYSGYIEFDVLVQY